MQNNCKGKLMTLSDLQQPNWPLCKFASVHGLYLIKKNCLEKNFVYLGACIECFFMKLSPKERVVTVRQINFCSLHADKPRFLQLLYMYAICMIYNNLQNIHAWLSVSVQLTWKGHFCPVIQSYYSKALWF